jgi:chemotaxis protein MotD
VNDSFALPVGREVGTRSCQPCQGDQDALIFQGDTGAFTIVLSTVAARMEPARRRTGSEPVVGADTGDALRDGGPDPDTLIRGSDDTSAIAETRGEKDHDPSPVDAAVQAAPLQVGYPVESALPADRPATNRLDGGVPPPKQMPLVSVSPSPDPPSNETQSAVASAPIAAIASERYVAPFRRDHVRADLADSSKRGVSPDPSLEQASSEVRRDRSDIATPARRPSISGVSPDASPTAREAESRPPVGSQPTAQTPSDFLVSKVVEQVARSVSEAPERTEFTADAFRLQSERPFAPVVRVLKLQLAPESVGVVDVMIARSDDRLRMRLEVENSATAASLNAERTSLIEQMAAAGLTVSELTIDRASSPDAGAIGADTQWTRSEDRASGSSAYERHGTAPSTHAADSRMRTSKSDQQRGEDWNSKTLPRAPGSFLGVRRLTSL